MLTLQEKNSIKSIQLVLENVEVIELFPEEIDLFQLDGLNYTFTRNTQGMLEPKTYADSFLFMTNEKTDRQYSDNYEGQTIRDRLTGCSDICYIIITYYNEETDMIYIEWLDGSRWDQYDVGQDAFEIINPISKEKDFIIAKNKKRYAKLIEECYPEVLNA